MLLFPLLITTAVVINEVLYDPPGADAGGEFVELFNPGPEAVDLAGFRLEFANGADGPAWQLRWEGTPADRLEPGAIFLVVDEGWTGPPGQAEVRLALQNGPDAVRLVSPAGTTDTVGWGDLAHPELAEGAPAPDVAGLALARRPDGHDSGDNARDFRQNGPTPGQLNWPRFAPSVASLAWEPPALAAAGRPARLQLTLANAGLVDLAGARATVTVGDQVAAATLPPLPPDSTTTLDVILEPAAEGLQPVDLVVLGDGPADTARLDLGRYQVGPSDLRLAEVMAAPAEGGEWCEIHNAGDAPRDLADLAIRDHDGDWRPLPAALLAPGACQLVAQDAAELAAWLARLAAAGAPRLCEPEPPLAVAGWPALNNSAPAGREFADRLLLGLADGTVLDHVTLGLGSGRAPAARSLERGPDGAWRPATTAAGATPGCLPPPPPAPGARLEFAPNPFSAREGGGTIRAAFTVPSGRQGWELRIYDLWGGLIRDLGGDDLGAGPRVVEWDGRDDRGQAVAAGGYVALLRWRGPAGGLSHAARRLIVVRETRP